MAVNNNKQQQQQQTTTSSCSRRFSMRWRNKMCSSGQVTPPTVYLNLEPFICFSNQFKLRHKNYTNDYTQPAQHRQRSLPSQQSCFSQQEFSELAALPLAHVERQDEPLQSSRGRIGGILRPDKLHVEHTVADYSVLPNRSL